MAETPYDVVHSWLGGQLRTRGHFHTDGREIRSYNMLLACRDTVGNIRLYYHPRSRGGGSISVTTSRHMRALETVLGERLDMVSTNGVWLNEAMLLTEPPSFLG